MRRCITFVLLTIFAAFMAISAMAQDGGRAVKTIVIDAGHGGAYPGAVYGGVKEKDINLKIALKLGALIEKELPGVKVVYTRKTDVALGNTLREDLTARANIANRANADFFISIHANASKKSTVYGAETLIMGESEKETQYSEDAIIANNKEEIIDMSDENTAAMVRAYIQNLQFTYGQYSETMARLMQKHYARNGRKSRDVRRQLLKVLYATDMPSVLTEVGFMTNSKELAYMKSEKGQDAYARMLCDAVKEYVELMNSLYEADSDSAKSAAESQPKTENVSSTTPEVKAESQSKDANKSQTKPAAQAKSQAKSNSGYTIQLAASDKILKSNDPWFKDYRGSVVRRNGSGRLPYKYCYGEYATRDEAQADLKRVKKLFKDAYVVGFEGDKVK